MCHFENIDRVGPLSFKVGNDQDPKLKYLWELAMNPKGGQLWNVWWYQGDLFLEGGQHKNAGWYQMNLPMSPPLLEYDVDTGLPELSGPIGKVFDILSSNSKTNDYSNQEEEHYDTDEMYGTDCEEDND